MTRSSRRRLLGAAWFGLWGVAAAGFVYLVPALDRPGVLDVPMFLYVSVPGVPEEGEPYVRVLDEEGRAVAEMP